MGSTDSPGTGIAAADTGPACWAATDSPAAPAPVRRNPPDPDTLIAARSRGSSVRSCPRPDCRRPGSSSRAASSRASPAVPSRSSAANSRSASSSAFRAETVPSSAAAAHTRTAEPRVRVPKDRRLAETNPPAAGQDSPAPVATPAPGRSSDRSPASATSSRSGRSAGHSTRPSARSASAPGTAGPASSSDHPGEASAGAIADPARPSACATLRTRPPAREPAASQAPARSPQPRRARARRRSPSEPPRRNRHHSRRRRRRRPWVGSTAAASWAHRAWRAIPRPGRPAAALPWQRARPRARRSSGSQAAWSRPPVHLPRRASRRH